MASVVVTCEVMGSVVVGLAVDGFVVGLVVRDSVVFFSVAFSVDCLAGTVLFS